MCRTAGRRCPCRNTPARRDAENARRRVQRNIARAAAARENGDDAKAGFYDGLVDKARTDLTQVDDRDATWSSAVANWRSSLTEQEREAWDTYGSIAHADINQRLRDGNGSLDGLDDDERATVVALDGALARAPRTDRPHRVHRGMQTSRMNGRGEVVGEAGGRWVGREVRVGETVTMHGFTSTTRDPAQAEYFSGANGEYSTSGVMFEIDTTQGGDWGSDGPEAEVTLARGTTFQVTGVDHNHTVNGKPYPLVRMREVAGQRCPDCGQYAGAGHTCQARPGPDTAGHPLAVADPEQVDFGYVRNPVSSTAHMPKGDVTYGQDIEPAGRYLSQRSGSHVPDGWESGQVTFTRPLHLAYGDSSRDWKERLSAHYGGKTGRALSQAVRDDGFDAITTRDKYGMSEVVDLTGFRPAASTKAAAAPSGWDRSTTHPPKQARTYGTHLGQEHGVEVDLSGGPDADSYVVLSRIIVPKDARGSGVGRKAMAELVAEADRNGWRLALTPDGEWGSSVPRLRKFYKEFGFVENKGRSRDFRTRETMIRQPS